MNRRNLRAGDPAPPAAQDSSDWIDGIARGLIRRAARGTPSPLAERLEEEWLADLASRRSRLGRLRLAAGCCWATRAIARDHCATSLSAASTSSGHGVAVAHLHFDPSQLSRRTVIIIAIVGVHAALIYGFASGLAQRMVAVIPSVLHSDVIQEQRERSQPPPLPQPRLAPQTLDIPRPLVDLQGPPDSGTIDVAPPRQAREIPGHSTPVPPAVTRVIGGPGAGFPDTDDFYPPMARRLGESGAATVRTCVDDAGRLTSEPSVLQSSGIPRLDAAALKLAKAGSGHYRPTTENGRRTSSCFAFRVRFRFVD